MVLQQVYKKGWPVVLLALGLSACGAPANSPDSEKPVMTTVNDVPPPHPFPNAEKLVGFSASQVKDLLGEPSLLRADKPAQYWQYAGRACTLGLFLYEGATSEALTVEHFAVFGRKGAHMTAKDCLYNLLVVEKTK